MAIEQRRSPATEPRRSPAIECRTGRLDVPNPYGWVLSTPVRRRTLALLGEMRMNEHIEVYTADAVVTGSSPADTDLRDVLESAETLHVENPIWTPLDERPGLQQGPAVFSVDDVIAVVGGSDPRLAVHANWHDVIIQAGPYKVTGLLPVLPGFDPGRALTRPGSTFLLLRDAKLELIGRPEAGELEREFILVNRYAAERVATDLELGFFFPAAHFETLEGVPAG